MYFRQNAKILHQYSNSLIYVFFFIIFFFLIFFTFIHCFSYFFSSMFSKGERNFLFELTCSGNISLDGNIMVFHKQIT